MDYCKHCGQFIEEGELVLCTANGLIHDQCFDHYARELAWQAGAFLVYGETEKLTDSIIQAQPPEPGRPNRPTIRRNK